MILTKKESGLIQGGSMFGSHEVTIYKNKIVANDPGGFLTSAKTTEAFFKLDEVKLRIYSPDGYSGDYNRLTFESTRKSLEVSLSATLDDIEKLLFETHLNQVEFNGRVVEIDGLLQHPEGLTYVKIEYLDKKLQLVHDFDFEEIFLKAIKSVQPLRENSFSIVLENATYKIAVNPRAISLLKQLIADLSTFAQMGNSENSIEMKYKEKAFIAFPKNEKLEIYSSSSLELLHIFEAQNTQLYLGETYLLMKHGEVLFVCENNVTKKICMEFKIVPKKLHQFSEKTFLMKKNEMRYFTELVCWLEEGKWQFFEVSINEIVATYLEQDVKVSANNLNIIVLPDGLLNVAQSVDFVEAVDTPSIYFSTTEFPMYFERIGSQVRISVPNDTILQESVDTFYQRSTKQEGDVLIVQGIANTTICLPLAFYKSFFKEHLYELRLPTLQEVHTEKVLLSRARNMSDLVLFEFFGQWQIILDYVQEKMKKEYFTEAEITQFGLYLYHATFQQRKRMEELANKYPQFMYALSQELTVDPRLNQIYQKQQREMFQLAAQMKSQFTEVESLLSQITYIHFNNDEYQKRLKEAQQAATTKKVGVSVAAGIGIGIATGGIGLLIPAMTVFTEWINAGHRRELDAIQQEKEFKKNEFLFKKAIDLILHMNDFTINYHVQTMNQFTYNNLRLEAEVLAVDNTEQYKCKLLKQSIDIYAKTSLPIDYDTQLKPNKLIESILTVPQEKTDKTVSLFLE